MPVRPEIPDFWRKKYITPYRDPPRIKSWWMSAPGTEKQKQKIILSILLILAVYPLEIIDLLSSLHGRNVALFGTCGMGAGSRYYSALEQNARVWLSNSNNFLGSFFCQGKMPDAIRQKYESYRGKCEDAKLDKMLSYFDEAASHPNKQDFMHGHMFAERMLDRIKELSLEYA